METKVSDILKEKFHLDFAKLSEEEQRQLSEIEHNNGVCWVRDLYEKNKNNLSNIAILYRGTKITYEKLFDMALKYAAAFSKKGITSTSEVPVMMSNCPEFLYTIMGLNLLGAKFHSLAMFDKTYLEKAITECGPNFIICTDDKYGKLKKIIDKVRINERLVFSLTDSLINKSDPYIELDKEFYNFTNKVPGYKRRDKRLTSQSDLLKLIECEKIKTLADYTEANLDTDFSITYTNDFNNPKPVIHSNCSFITSGRLQASILSKLPPKLVSLAMTPNHYHDGIISNMSDVLYKGGTIAMEPIFDKKFFMTSIAINRPNYLTASKDMIVYGAKQLYSDPRFKGFKMPFMRLLTATGKSISKGEEKFINKMLRKVFAPLPLSISSGDSERGTLFFTPYLALKKLFNPKMILSKTPWGLEKNPTVQLKIVDKNGYEVAENQVGILYARTPNIYKGYKNNQGVTSVPYTTDAQNEKWSNTTFYASRQENGTYKVLEPIGKELLLSDCNKLPLFYIGKEVEKDTKHILAYEIVNVANTIVIHVEFQPNTKNNTLKILSGIERRIIKNCGQEVASKIFFRVRTFAEGFPTNKNEERDYDALVKEGINDKCVKLSDCMEIGKIARKVKKLLK